MRVLTPSAARRDCLDADRLEGAQRLEKWTLVAVPTLLKRRADPWADYWKARQKVGNTRWRPYGVSDAAGDSVTDRAR